MTPEGSPGIWEAFVVLAVGAAAILVLATALARSIRRAVWQRTIWQAAVLGLLGMVVLELSGAATAVVALCRQARRVASTSAVAPALSDNGHRTAAGKSTGQNDMAPDPAPMEPVRIDRVSPSPKTNADDASVDSRRLMDGDSDPASQATREGENDSPSTKQVVPSAAPLPHSSLSAPGEPEPWLWPGLLWAFGTLLFLARIVYGRLLLVQFRGRGVQVADREFCSRVRRIAARLGVARTVVVLEAQGIGSPAAFGVFRPTLAIPAGFRNEFSSAQQEAMLAHELAHIAAGDLRWQLAADLACAVLWWHPAAWRANGQLRAVAEIAADEASLLVPDGPDLLAECLVALGRQIVARPLGWLSMAGPPFRSRLGRRVERLLALPADRQHLAAGWHTSAARATLPAALLVLALFCTAWARPQADSSKGETAMSVMRSSFGRSLAATVVAAVLSPLATDAMAAGPPEGPPKPDEVRRGEGDRPREADRERREEPRREGEEARRDEGRGEQGPEAQALRHELEVLRLAMPALREAERRDAAELLERAIHAREVTLEGRRDDEARQIRERSPKPRQLAEILMVAARAWQEFNQPEKAEQVERLAHQLAGPRDRPEGPPGSERHETEPGEQRRMMAERRELEMALERSRAETREIEERLRGFDGAGSSAGGPRPEGPPEDAERRMDHLRAAMENLHAAGLHEQADRLARDADRLMREPPRDGAPWRAESRPPNITYPPRPPQVHYKQPADGQLESVIRELREQMEQMRRELDELRRERERPPRDEPRERR